MIARGNALTAMGSGPRCTVNCSILRMRLIMKMQAKLLAVCGFVAFSGAGYTQGYYGESMAALDMSDTLNNQMGGPGMGGPPPVPGQVGGVGNPAAGFAPGQMGGNTAPGMDAGVMDPTMMGMQGQAGGYTAAAPTPIPTEEVLTGRRVYDAVSGGLLEDAIEISVRQSDADVYADDGVNDNGIAGDGIRGNVNTSRDEFIGAFSNIMKKYLIHAVNNAEQIDPLIYYGYYVAKIDPRPVEGLKRYGLPLPGEEDELDTAIVHVEPDFPSIIDLEHDRDELVRRWNYEFLAEYRVEPNDPQSEYFPVFVPSPPLTPANYPVPTGYVAPQAGAIATQQAVEASAAAAIAVQQAQPVTTGGVGDLGGGGMI